MLRQIFIFISLSLFSSVLYANVAKITSLSGSASIERDGSIQSASLGKDLLAKDTVSTSVNSKAQLTFKDNTIITVGKQSRFSIEEYLYKDSPTSEAKFSVLSGTVRAMSGKIGKIAPEKFTVKTKTATIGIRGTDFIVHIAEDGTVFVYCLQGTITVRDSNGNLVTVEAGSFVRISPKGLIQGPDEFNSDELKKLLDDGFYIPYTLTSRDKVSLDTKAEPLIAAEGTQEILHPDESLDRGNLPNTQELISDASQNSITDQIKEPSAIVSSDPQTFTGFTTYIEEGINGSMMNTGTLTLTSTPSTSSVSGSISFDYPSTGTVNLGNTNTYTALDAFDIKLDTLNSSPVAASSHIFTASDTQNDYFSWGEWQVDANDPTSENSYHGYWAAGVSSPTTVIDSFRDTSSSLTYNGNVIGEVKTFNSDGYLSQTNAIASGTSQITIDFETDSFEAQFHFATSNDNYELEFNNGTVNSSNQLSANNISNFTSDNHGDIRDSYDPYGKIQGGIYGTDGKTAGGVFNASSSVSGSDTIKVQGAFKATAP